MGWARAALPCALGLAALLAAPGATAKPGRSDGKSDGRTAGRKKGKLLAHAGPSLPPPSLSLLGFDLQAGVARVEVVGSARPPEQRFFAFLDERGRRFLPSQVDCQASEEDKERERGRWQCTLGIPRIYQRTAVVGLLLQVRGQTVVSEGEKVIAAWTEARKAAPLPAAERPRDQATPRVRLTPDGKPTIDPDGVDSETEE